MVRHAYRVAYGILLALIGFVFGTAGMHAANDGVAAPDAGESRARVATACVPDSIDDKQDEIFFLSCGGLF